MGGLGSGSEDATAKSRAPHDAGSGEAKESEERRGLDFGEQQPESKQINLTIAEPRRATQRHVETAPHTIFSVSRIYIEP